jgi:hypothetical protein
VEPRNAERSKLQADRDKLRATDPQGLADAWAMIEGLWSGTVIRARELPEPVLHEQVDGDWSLVQTHRHLVLATDCWLRRMVRDRPSISLVGPRWIVALQSSLLGHQPDADPSLDEVLDLRWERMDEVRDVIAGATAEDLDRICVPPNTPGHPRKDHTVLQCPHVILTEEWQHHRYAVRDLAVLEKRPRGGVPGHSDPLR